MKNAKPKLVSLPEPFSDIRWKKALEFYRAKKRIVFVNDHDRFWEPHGFVQQSLAQELANEGIEVVWLDGKGFGRYRPTLPWDSPYLKVMSQGELPGKRLGWIDSTNIAIRTMAIKNLLKEDALLWVQAGIDERIAERLSKIDVFSVFDNPYLHLAEDPLVQKAKVVVSQNAYSRDLLARSIGVRSRMLLPPVNIEISFGESENFALPDGFPRPVLGYIGSCFAKAYDFSLFETFVENFPQYGFLIAGRTDADGHKMIEKLKTYGNFIYIPWVPREKVGPLWKSLDLSLLFYRALWEQDGAFPIKILESLLFGVPSIATHVHKTVGLSEDFFRSPYSSCLREKASQILTTNNSKDLLFEKYHALMHPRYHLAQVAEWLGG